MVTGLSIYARWCNVGTNILEVTNNVWLNLSAIQYEGTYAWYCKSSQEFMSKEDIYSTG